MQGFTYHEAHAAVETIANSDHFSLFENLSDGINNIFHRLNVGFHREVDFVKSKFTLWQNLQKSIESIKNFTPNMENQSPLKSILLIMFSLLEKVIFTPVSLFDNDYFRGILLKFGALSMGLVTSFVMLEGIKRIFNKSKSSYKQVLQKLPLVLGTVGFAPLLIVESMKILSFLTALILKMGVAMIGGQFNYTDGIVKGTGNALIDAVLYGAFVVLFTFQIIPILLSHGRRWFNMMSLTMLTPLAMLGYIFDSLSQFHKKWWSSLKKSYLSQIYYAGFVTILHLIMFGIPTPMTYQGVFSKLLIVLGGLHAFANPPGFIANLTNNGMDTYRSINQFKNNLKNNPTKSIIKSIRNKLTPPKTSGK